MDDEDEKTWALVTFAHDEEWDEKYWAEGGCPCIPDFKTLLEWYFYGALKDSFEQEEGIKPTYKWYQEWKGW